MHLLYNFGIRIYGILLRVAALFNPKAKLWIDGRKNWRLKLIKQQDKINNCFWFHCASLGEFEQGRPLMEALKNAYPDTPLLITFFSPSGYENKKRYPLADYICYLPLDTPSNARYFINTVRPKAVFFVKYEFWNNMLSEIQKSRTPLYSIAGNFRSEQKFFTKKNPFYTSALRTFNHLFVQNEKSLNLLKTIGLENVSVCGDTRYDRVWQNAQVQLREEHLPNEVIRDFVHNSKTMILGSTWAVEHDILIPLINANKIEEKVIIAPHEVDTKSLKALENALVLPNFRYSHHEDYAHKEHKRVLIIDGIGMLANTYSVGAYAYIGGAFGKGLHNILEPAVFGLPVIFGPNFSKFPEAQEFIDNGIGFPIKNADEFMQARAFILANHISLKQKTRMFMESKLGATQMILAQLKEDLV